MEEIYHVCESSFVDSLSRFSAPGPPIMPPDLMAETPQYEKKLADYNMGTLVRKQAARNYAEDNAILVTRAQFVAIEVSYFHVGSR